MDAVVIVGGGPVGLALSLVLARYDVPSVVLEERAAPTPEDESRAIAWMPRGLELLDWLGLGADFDRVGMRRTEHQIRTPWDQQLLTMRFDALDSPHQYSLQLPQHHAEALLEAAARSTGRVEVRRGHRVVGVGEAAGLARVDVEGPEGPYTLKVPWAVGCDGARSEVRRQLGIDRVWRDYGMDSAVADFEMECGLPPEVSRITLDPKRPTGFFCFWPGRWRFIYRLNKGEDREEMTTEARATELMKSKLPEARVKRFLWASAFRLGQGQCATYRRGRWLLAGDAAHAMGPSAGAGLMVGLLGMWRLGWRLALAAQGHARGEALLDDYVREQRAAVEEVQAANALIFRNMALRNRVLGMGRTMGMALISRVSRVVEGMTEKEALLRQVLPVGAAVDSGFEGPWRRLARLGAWEAGRRMPQVALPGGGTVLDRMGLKHRLLPVGRLAPEEEARFSAEVASRCPVPLEWEATRDSTQPWRVPGARRTVLALIRPDEHIAALLTPLGPWWGRFLSAPSSRSLPSGR